MHEQRDRCLDKTKKKRLLPKNITERPDHEVMERVVGKRAMREIDALVNDVSGREERATLKHEAIVVEC